MLHKEHELELKNCVRKNKTEKNKLRETKKYDMYEVIFYVLYNKFIQKRKY